MMKTKKAAKKTAKIDPVVLVTSAVESMRADIASLGELIKSREEPIAPQFQATLVAALHGRDGERIGPGQTRAFTWLPQIGIPVGGPMQFHVEPQVPELFVTDIIIGCMSIMPNVGRIPVSALRRFVFGQDISFQAPVRGARYQADDLTIKIENLGDRERVLTVTFFAQRLDRLKKEIGAETDSETSEADGVQ